MQTGLDYRQTSRRCNCGEMSILLEGSGASVASRVWAGSTKQDFKVLANVTASLPTTVSLTGLRGFSRHDPLLSYLQTFVYTLTSTEFCHLHPPTCPLLSFQLNSSITSSKSGGLKVWSVASSISWDLEMHVLRSHPGPPEPGTLGWGPPDKNHCSMIHFLFLPSASALLPTASKAGHGALYTLHDIPPSVRSSCLSPTPT